jgi:RNA polymerase sigma-70 factor (ECF subfamily)
MSEVLNPSPGTSAAPGSTRGDRLPALAVLDAWVDEHADFLFRYAVPRLRDRHAVEEVLQETFLAALEAVAGFRGDSSPRTWLVGLLRRKIADHYRKRYREGEGESIDTTDPTIDAWFDEKGGWIAQPKGCELDPAELQERTDFWAVLQSCLQALPERLATAFTLRVVDDRKPDEVCKVLSITPTNLWVALHRARARLRACLEANWFESGGAGGE